MLSAAGAGACLMVEAGNVGTIAESPHIGLDVLAESLGVGGFVLTVRSRDAGMLSSARGIELVIRGRTWSCAATGTTARRKGKARESFFMATLNPLNCGRIRRRATMSNQAPAWFTEFSKWINDQNRRVSDKT